MSVIDMSQLGGLALLVSHALRLFSGLLWILLSDVFHDPLLMLDDFFQPSPVQVG